jgi:hypothetical protein
LFSIGDLVLLSGGMLVIAICLRRMFRQKGDLHYRRFKLRLCEMLTSIGSVTLW